MSKTRSAADRVLNEGMTLRTPVMKVNAHDRVSAGMMSIVFGLVVGVICVLAWWASLRPAKTEEFLVPMEMVEGRGGSPDGELGESLLIESPEDPNDNPSQTETNVDDVVLDEVVSTIESQAGPAGAEISGPGTREVTANASMSTGLGVATGRPGSSHGTGNRRGLGTGPGPGGGGISSEERWFIRYSDEASLDEYARQLDYFGVELGALLPGGKLVYLRNLSQPAPTVVETTSGKDEKRLYMTWQGGSRKQADMKLFQKVGIDVANAVMFHFYPKLTEQLLLKTEFDYAHRREVEIRRTYFSIEKSGNDYRFVVTRQTYVK
ncbi:hypothetical protein SH661x_000977 [Planctomicrobium sp. SH661]|uniref:hypothetical protein n=1 Tax=Planctomicrobium sp. SH661 TaxID=3448124 RepID=UPI003F5AF15E